MSGRKEARSLRWVAGVGSALSADWTRPRPRRQTLPSPLPVVRGQSLRKRRDKCQEIVADRELEAEERAALALGRDQPLELGLDAVRATPCRDQRGGRSALFGPKGAERGPLGSAVRERA